MKDTGNQELFGEINSPDFLEHLKKGGPESQKAYAMLVKAMHDRLFGFVHRHLSSHEECQEVVQETYLAVHNGLAGFEGKSKLSTWIYSMAYHKVCDKISEKDRSHVELTEAAEALLNTEKELDSWDTATPWDASADKVLKCASVESLIGEAIRALPPNVRQVYHLRDSDGLSGEEVAAILKLTDVNVRVQLHRARRFIVDWVREKMKQRSSLGKGAGL